MALTGEQAFVLAQSYTNETAIGMGAIKGAAAQIQSVSDNPDGSHKITWLYEDNEGKRHTAELIVKDGEKGEQGLQGAQGEPGENGFSPIITVEENTQNSYKLKIITEFGEYITPNLKGTGTATGDYDDLTDKPSINGRELQGNMTADDLNIQTKLQEISSDELKAMWS